MPNNLCIVCFTLDCHKEGCLEAEARINRAYQEAEEEKSASEDDQKPEEVEEEVDSDVSYFAYHVSTARSYASLEVQMRHCYSEIDTALLDVGSTTPPLVGSDQNQGLIAASFQPSSLDAAKSRSLKGVGGFTKTQGVIKFSFYFDGQLYQVDAHVIPGDQDVMKLSYQLYWKIIERPADGYTEAVDYRNNGPYLVFTTQDFLTSTELRSMHRNLGNPEVEN